MESQTKYPCEYAVIGDISGGSPTGIRCKLTGKYQCPASLFEYDLSEPHITGRMQDCPGMNLPRDLAKKIIEFRVEEEKRSMLENISAEVKGGNK